MKKKGTKKADPISEGNNNAEKVENLDAKS